MGNYVNSSLVLYRDAADSDAVKAAKIEVKEQLLSLEGKACEYQKAIADMNSECVKYERSQR